MIAHLSRSQRVSLAVHSFYAALAVTLGVIEGFWMWRALFNSQDVPAVIAVAVFDGLCLSGYLLALLRGGGPLAWFSHALPVVSFVPLAWGAHLLMSEGLPPWVGPLISIVGAAWLGGIDWLCLRHIAQLCTPPTVVKIDPTVALIEELRAKVDAAQQVQRAYFDLVATGQQALVAQAHSLAAPAPQSAPQASAELVVVPPERPTDPLWPAKVEAWRMKPGSSWEVVAARFDKSTSTVRGWVAQVEEAING